VTARKPLRRHVTSRRSAWTPWRSDFDSFGEQDKGPGEFPLATPEEADLIQEAF